MSIEYECSDFLQFQEYLKKLRDVDDKLVYALNVSIPTQSFKGQENPEANCKDLYQKLRQGYDYRQQAIKKCIVAQANQVKVLKDARDKQNDADSFDMQLDKNFKAEQRKLRLLQAELNVEDILREKSFKMFNERCRTFFKADKL
ncbi:protein MIX23 [Culicoides brevitarsis]|uniref:protein MIX23 n=1 Tax=Culicoides brevitarsis TaxID=469753 RepID=UPI00307CBE46